VPLAGADVNFTDHEVWAPLRIAASWKDHIGVGILLEFAGQRLDRSATPRLLAVGGESAAQLPANDGIGRAWALIELCPWSVS
jgi:hypothetical protein